MTETQQLLERYLPPRDGRGSGQRLMAIAGRALADARRRVPELTAAQAEDAYGKLLEAGTDAAVEYRPDLDDGSGHPLDVRFGRFAYVRMRQRFTDWYRKEIHDNRPGKSDRRVELLDPEDDTLRLAQQLTDPATFDTLALSVAARLTPLQRWSLDHVAQPASEGLALVVIAQRTEIPIRLAELLLDDLRTALAKTDLTEAAA